MTPRTMTLAVAVLLSGVLCAAPEQASRELPASARAQLARNLAAASAHRQHLWRDTTPINADGTINGLVEIARGDRRKFELDMGRNMLAIDRVIPESIGGYPVNYGFVPQTVSYDGDPFDVLVIGPAVPGGEIVRGLIVGLMYMEDDKGPDSKVVIAPVGGDGRASHELTATVRDEIADYFRRYKTWEPGKVSTVAGWGSITEGRDYVNTTHAFFLQCRTPGKEPCRVTDGVADRDDRQR